MNLFEQEVVFSIVNPPSWDFVNEDSTFALRQASHNTASFNTQHSAKYQKWHGVTQFLCTGVSSEKYLNDWTRQLTLIQNEEPP